MQLSKIIRERFSDDYDAVVAAIAEITGQRITVRTVQSWKAAPDKVSYRRVPEWALAALERYTQQPDKARELKERANQRDASLRHLKTPYEQSEEVRKRTSVERATRIIEIEEQEQQEWRNAAGKELGNLIFNAINSHQKEISSLSQVIASILSAIENSSNFTETKSKIKESISSLKISSHYIEETKLAIQNRVHEFSNEQGLPTNAE